MTTVNPYLYFNGNCEKAFNFYRLVFEKEFAFIGRFKDVPKTDRQTFSEPDEKIMHVSLPISAETILMGCDNTQLFQQPGAVKNISLYVSTDSRAEAERLYSGLSKGGKVILAIADTFWGSYYGILEDQFGVSWKVSCNSK